jgi:hypothetical protein
MLAEQTPAIGGAPSQEVGVVDDPPLQRQATPSTRRRRTGDRGHGRGLRFRQGEPVRRRHGHGVAATALAGGQLGGADRFSDTVSDA